MSPATATAGGATSESPPAGSLLALKGFTKSFGAVQALKVQQVTAAVHDGDGHGPVVLQRFSLGCRGDGLDIGGFQ